jgi:amino acid transporter
MHQPSTTDGQIPADAANHSRLRRNALGTSAIVFILVAGAAPLAATTGASPLIFGAVGIGGAGEFVVAGVALLLFAVGYLAMSRYVVSAGGFASFVSRGLGAPVGLAAGFVAMLAYVCNVAGISGQFGSFAHDVMSAKLGIDLPWQVWIGILLAVVGVFGYHDIRLSARVLGVFMIAEVIVILILDIAVTGSGGNSGLSATAFKPSEVFGGATGVGLLFAYSAFTGFEVAPVYGEEAHDPKRTVSRATYIGLFIIAAFFTYTMWSIGVGYGSHAVTKAAAANPVNFVFALNTRYVGSFTTSLMNYLVLTGLFAGVSAMHNTATRYVFSLGRVNALPRFLARTHKRSHAPHVASLVVSAITVLIVGVFALFKADPFNALFAWLAGLATVAVIVLEAMVSVAVIVFFRRTRVDSRIWNTVLAPFLGLCALLVSLHLALHNFNNLTGVKSGPVTLLPWVIPLAAAIGLAVWFAKRRETSIDVGSAEFIDDGPTPVGEAEAVPVIPS